MNRSESALQGGCGVSDQGRDCEANLRKVMLPDAPDPDQTSMGHVVGDYQYIGHRIPDSVVGGTGRVAIITFASLSIEDSPRTTHLQFVMHDMIKQVRVVFDPTFHNGCEVAAEAV